MTTRYAQIIDSIVANVIESEADPDGTNGSWIACGDAGPGWQCIDGVFSPPDSSAVNSDTRITAVAFKRRLTQAERIAIRNLAKTNDVAFDFQDLLDSSQAVHLTDSDVSKGLAMLEAAGKLAPGRADEILSAPIQQVERPA